MSDFLPSHQASLNKRSVLYSCTSQSNRWSWRGRVQLFLNFPLNPHVCARAQSPLKIMGVVGPPSMLCTLDRGDAHAGRGPLDFSLSCCDSCKVWPSQDLVNSALSSRTWADRLRSRSARAPQPQSKPCPNRYIHIKCYWQRGELEKTRGECEKGSMQGKKAGAYLMSNERAFLELWWDGHSSVYM